MLIDDSHIVRIFAIFRRPPAASRIRVRKIDPRHLRPQGSPTLGLLPLDGRDVIRRTCHCARDSVHE